MGHVRDLALAICAGPGAFDAAVGDARAAGLDLTACLDSGESDEAADLLEVVRVAPEQAAVAAVLVEAAVVLVSVAAESEDAVHYGLAALELAVAGREGEDAVGYGADENRSEAVLAGSAVGKLDTAEPTALEGS